MSWATLKQRRHRTVLPKQCKSKHQGLPITCHTRPQFPGSVFFPLTWRDLFIYTDFNDYKTPLVAFPSARLLLAVGDWFHLYCLQWQNRLISGIQNKDKGCLRLDVYSLRSARMTRLLQTRKEKYEGLKNMLFLNENKLGIQMGFFFSRSLVEKKIQQKENMQKIIMFLSVFNKSYQHFFFFFCFFPPFLILVCVLSKRHWFPV